MTVIAVDFGEPEKIDGAFRSVDACQIADITFRQLDYWARTGLAEPSIRPAHGSGSQRLYSEDDVLRLCVLSTMVRAGLTLDVLRAHVQQILSSAADGIGFFSVTNVVVTVNVAALRGRVEQHKQAGS